MFEYYGHIHVYSPRAGADKKIFKGFFLFIAMAAILVM